MVLQNVKRGGTSLPIVSDDLASHFIRGLFDGDGSYTKNHIQIVGTEQTCRWLLNLTQRLVGVGGGAYERPNRGCWLWDVSGGRQTPKLMNWIYKNPTRYLERKYYGRQSV